MKLYVCIVGGTTLIVLAIGIVKFIKEFNKIKKNKYKMNHLTKFNPDNKVALTYGEALSPAMKITEQEDADQYFKEYVAFQEKQLLLEPRTDGMTASEMCRINLGYFAGYYGYETMERVNLLFLAPHPILNVKQEDHEEIN